MVGRGLRRSKCSPSLFDGSGCLRGAEDSCGCVVIDWLEAERANDRSRGGLNWMCFACYIF